QLMPRNRQRLQAWKASVGGTESTILDQVREHLDNDLNTPDAIAAIDAAAAAGHDVSASASLLGVELSAPLSPA
ncbi:MAG: cysteine--1-D-myo-inosityl 2-amino-2-deoxy-alpha-D-glucopyranoside ligase, partial [Acidimicrobiaceae bacterium]